MTITIKLDGVPYEFESVYDTKIAEIKCWYNPHLRLWEVYPVNKAGDQLEETRYGYGKVEALEIKQELEGRIGEEC